MRVRNMLEVRLLHDAARTHGKMLESLPLDPLTGLANRRLPAERMSMALDHARRNNSTMAVGYLDLDGFKQIRQAAGNGGRSPGARAPGRGAGGLCGGCRAHADVKREPIFFPSLGTRAADGGWLVEVHAWCFKMHPLKIVVPVVRNLLGFERARLTVAQKDIFVERARWMFVDNRCGGSSSAIGEFRSVNIGLTQSSFMAAI